MPSPGGTEKSGWTFFKKPEYVAARLGATKGGQDGLEGAARKFKAAWQETLSQIGGGQPVPVEFRTYRKGGRKYIAPSGPRRRGEHRPSLPGRPPAMDTAELRDSIQISGISMRVPQKAYKVPKRKGGTRDIYGPTGNAPVIGTQRILVFTNLKYATFLEYGAGPGSPFRAPAPNAPILPRPHLRPTIAFGMRGIQQDMMVTIQSNLLPPKLTKLDVSKIRRTLLRMSAKLGSLQLFGINSQFLFMIRQKAIKTERVLGDYDAFRNGQIAARMRRRIVGRNLGLQIGRMVGQGGSKAHRAIRRTARTTLGALFAPLIR